VGGGPVRAWVEQCSAVQCGAVQCSAVRCSAVQWRPTGSEGWRLGVLLHLPHGPERPQGVTRAGH
jgi:hypothetical protein